MPQSSKLNQQPGASAPTLRVFYNSACPVCDAGIRQQRKKMPQCPVAWQDVHSNHELAKEVSSDLEFVRERLHVIDEAGQLHIGFDAFIAIWQRSPGETWKAKLSSPTPLRWCFNKIYNGVARMLYRWNLAKQHW